MRSNPPDLYFLVYISWVAGGCEGWLTTGCGGLGMCSRRSSVSISSRVGRRSSGMERRPDSAASIGEPPRKTRRPLRAAFAGARCAPCSEPGAAGERTHHAITQQDSEKRPHQRGRHLLPNFSRRTSQRLHGYHDTQDCRDNSESARVRHAHQQSQGLLPQLERCTSISRTIRRSTS